jgi:transposase
MSTLQKAQQIVNLEPAIPPTELRVRLIKLACPKSSTNRVVKTFTETGTLVDQRIFNAGVKKLTSTNRRVLSRKFNNATDVSQREMANKLGVHQSTISRTLVRDLGISFHKRKRAPYYSEDKKHEVLQAASRLYRNHFTSVSPLPIIIMDDESYVTANDGTRHSSQGYYSKCPESAPDAVKYSCAMKFPFKVGFWYAICDLGVSEAFVWSQGLAIDSHKYKTFCLQQRLIPFINSHNIRDTCIFWPDKASSHYSASVLAYLNSKQIAIVPKLDNPTNMPQCRPIENGHALIKRAIFQDGFHPKTAEELRLRTMEILARRQEILRPVYTNLSARVRKLLDSTRRGGLYAAHR